MTNMFARKQADSVFRNRITLLPDFVPAELPCREREIEQMVENLSILLDPDHTYAMNVAITGPPGIGKTTLAKRTLEDLKNVAVKNNINLDTFYINCHSFRTKTSILRRIAMDNFHIQGRGFSDEELLEMLAIRLEKENKRLVLALDEASMLSGKDILAFISMNELFMSGNGRLSILIICRRSEWSLLLSTELSGRVQDQINLQGYERGELETILTYRKEMAFYADVISDEVFDLIIDICSRSRNARFGIEILLRAGLKANAVGMNCITAEFVRAAKTEVYPELRTDIFQDLKKNELIAALAIGKILQRKNKVSTTVNESYEKFKLLSEEQEFNVQSLATYRQCIDSLEKLGIISHTAGTLKERKQERRSKITLYDIPAQILVERVERVI
ncbi:MAG: AAA family ATPase [Candidatus Heimdallarchaeota archaeon]|nr:AAA family ATPase [Candidatus Heimdallarchaeota archaeon]